MSQNHKIRAGLIGCGGWARHFHLHQMIDQTDTTAIVATCEPAAESVAVTRAIFDEAGLKAPPNETDLARFLDRFAGELDAVVVTTPHALHHDHAKACLEAGLDVLVEKPMVMTAAEAESLIATRDRVGKHLVVSFQGSLSPQVRAASRMLRSGELGELRSISATIWQDWRTKTIDTWRQTPHLSGGGFLFDTGAHMLNTVADLAGEDFVEVTAWIDQQDRPVDIKGTIMARLESGALVTMHGSGDTIQTCKSEIFVYCTEGIIRTGAWGERLQLQRNGRKTLRSVKVPASSGPWEQFQAVRNGTIANPSPPEIGLRMARLWDMIKASAAQDGQPVRAG